MSQVISEGILSNFVEMERYKINPFGCFDSMNQAVKKEKQVLRYFVGSLEPDDELYFMMHRFKQMLKCRKGAILGRNESEVGEYTGESEHPPTVSTFKKTLDCKSDADIHCSTKKRERKVDKMNMIINKCKKEGKPSIMVTIVPPVYLNTPLSDKEAITTFHKVIHKIFGTNQKSFTDKFCVQAKSKFYEIPVKAIDFRSYLHVHFVMTFPNRESKREFSKKFKEFKKKVYKIMAKHFNIRDKEYYKENCAYVRVISNPETGEKDILELENAEYLRKSYGGKKGKESKKKFKDWDENRRNYYKDNLKNPTHFDFNKGFFTVFSEDEEKVVRDFYSKVFVKSEKDDKFFCLNFDEILWIGGKITRKDLALKRTDYERYCKIMHLKTWALKRYLRQLSYLYEPGRTTIAISPIRIGNTHLSMLGGANKIEEELKQIREEKREEREMRLKRESENYRREKSIESIKDKEIRKEIKEISEENYSKYREEVKKQKTKLAKVAGFTFGKLDSEIFYRGDKILRIGTRLYDHLEELELETDEDLTDLQWIDCIKNEKGELDRENGLKRLYEFTEEFNLDRTQIFISEYLFKGNKYEDYFPVKISSDKSIDSALELKLGITLEEFDSIWYYYKIEDLKSIVSQLVKNAKDRKNLSREEFESNVNKILQKMRSIKRS